MRGMRGEYRKTWFVRQNVVRTAIGIAFAFVGVFIGAGFASGQEALQYFVAFGLDGIWGGLLTVASLTFAGLVMLALGSYFRAGEHSAVFTKITHPAVARFLDVAIMVTLFATGMVMIAGAGSNLEQQFGWPTWAGSVLMVILVCLTGLLDVDRVTVVIGAATPVIVICIVAACVYSIINAPGTLAELEPQTELVATTLPNWWVASINYVGLGLMVGVSMAIVMGGANHSLKASAIGGATGGLIAGLLMLLAIVAIFFAIGDVWDAELPILELVNRISPVFGYVMAIIVFVMIYNTAIAMFYAFAKRATANKPKQFWPVLVASSLVAFAVSFVGFSELVGYVYPAIGYVGMALLVILGVAWVKGRTKVREEIERRGRIRSLIRRKLDPAKRFTKKHEAQLSDEISASPVDDKHPQSDAHEFVHRELVADDSVDYPAESVDEPVAVAER